MKCLYYLAPTLDSTQQVSDDLHEAGVNDFFLHVITKDESGLKRQHIHSSNYLETLDLLRDGLIGAAIGFVVGLLGISWLMYARPFGPDVPVLVYAALVAVATLFGAWEGGLAGIATKNKKLAKFQHDIDAGRYLILIYTRRGKGAAVRSMMREKHPEAELVATDKHFINPFSAMRKRARVRRRPAASPRQQLQKD